MNETPSNFATGCAFILACTAVLCLIAFGLGYLVAWLIHT